MRPFAAAAASAILAATACAQRGDAVLAFVGFDGACDSPAAGSARLYAARADLDASPGSALAWVVSALAPLDLPPAAAACEWHVRPAVDPGTNRMWHFVGTCAADGAPPSGVVVAEWDVGAGGLVDPPIFVRACAFDSPTAGFDFVGFDARVHAGGPYLVNVSAGAVDGRPAVVGVTFPPPSARTGGATPPCALSPVTKLDVAANASGFFAADAAGDAALPPLLLHAHAGSYGSPAMLLTALSPTTGALQWQANVSTVYPEVVLMASAALFSRRFAALGVYSDGRFQHSLAVQGWAANASAATAGLMSDVLPYRSNPYTGPVSAAVAVWAPAAAQGADWPLVLFTLAVETSNALSRADGCRPGGVAAVAPAYVLTFTKPAYPNSTAQFPTVGCPLPAAQSCAFLAYAHGRPLVPTMAGRYGRWAAADDGAAAGTAGGAPGAA